MILLLRNRLIRSLLVLVLCVSVVGWIFSTLWIWNPANADNNDHVELTLMNGSMTVRVHENMQKTWSSKRRPTIIPHPFFIGTKGIRVAPKLRLGLRMPDFDRSVPRTVGGFYGVAIRKPIVLTMVIPFWVPIVACLLLMCLRTVVYRRRMRKLNLCLQCQYDLRGNASGVCPECGETIEAIA